MKTLLLSLSIIIISPTLFSQSITIGESTSSQFAGGNGSIDDPFQISTVEHLQNIESSPNKNFILISDINASKTRNWNDGKGFSPIGSDIIKFTGTINGNGFIIDSLFIDRPEENYVGIFGIVQDAFVQNVVSKNSIITGNQYVGGLIGRSISSIVKNSSSMGEVGIYDVSIYSGGLVGRSETSEIDSSNSVSIVKGLYNVGGLIGGFAEGSKITNSSSTGSVLGVGSVGGLIGNTFVTTEVSNSKSISDVSGDFSVGGFIGNVSSGSKITNSSSTGSVTGISDVGGFIGYIKFGSSITSSFSTSTVSGNQNVGGFIGLHMNGSQSSTVVGSFFQGIVNGGDKVGGFIGLIENSTLNGKIFINNSYTKGKVEGLNSVGGFIGVNLDIVTIENSYSSILVKGVTDIGGFIGINGGELIDNFWNSDSVDVNVNGIGLGINDGLKDLITSEMIGGNAYKSFNSFNFEDIWRLTNSFPVLWWEDKSTIPLPPQKVEKIYPNNESSKLNLSEKFIWNKEINSVDYQVQFSLDINFDGLTLDTLVTDTVFQNSELKYDTKYYWRVRGSNSTGDGEWSDEWSFSTKKEKPLIVKNSLPKVVTCGSNTLILKENGYLYGVGNNSWGQLGNGTLSTFRVEEWNQDVKMIDDFIQVRGFPKLIDFTCSNGTVYGVDESMDVWAVGNNSSGQTSVTDSSVILNPTKMNLDFKVSSLSSKTSHLLLINQDSTILYSLGRNSYGQLGNDNNVDSHIPQKVFEVEEGKIWSISTGGDVSGLLTSNGDLYLWGYNGFIQVKGTNLGSGNLNDKFYTPEFIMGNIKMFELGQKHTLAIDSTGQLTLWGYHRREGDSGLYNEKFYVENIVIDNQTLPELISQGNEVQLRAGNSVTMLVVDSRYLILWGEGDNGVLGNNNSSGTAEKQVIDILDYSESRIESIDLANNHVSVLLTSGELISWGNNRYSANGHSMEDYYKFDEEMGPSFGVQTPTLVEFKANQHFNINETENSFTPEIVHTSVTNDEFKIKVKSDEFHKFILSRSISGDDFKMIASFDSVYQDTSLESSTNYFYEITSLNKGGVQSPPISLEVKTKSNFYLHGNGITVMCPEANVGDVGEINGVLFTKRITDEITIQNASTTCTSGITSFYELFKDKTTFNEDIGHWDVSSVKDMFGMFWGATRFNVDISNWDVSNVTNMAVMFYSAKSFNQNISIWNTGNVEHMGSMFSKADSFNQNINTWDVSQVKNLSDMFAYNPTFNQPLSDWITSSVTDIHQIFLFATSFNQNINGWNVSNVTNMQNVFHGASSFNQPLDKWDVRKVVNFNATFKDAKSFNQDLSSWKLYSASVTNAIFSNSNVQNLNYTKMLNSWANDDSTMIFNTFDINSTFNQDAEAARSKLIEEFKWTINDEGFEPYSNQSPNLLTPFNEQINVGKLTEFTWDDLENTTTYQVQIAQDSQFSNILFDSSGISQSNLTLQVPLNENHKYQWRVRGLHSDSTLNTLWSDTLTFTTGVRTSTEDVLLPQEYTLSQNYPNPFNPSTQIQYALPEATEVTLEVFNSVGQKVMELVNGQQSAGYHTATFDASGLSSGVYLYKLTTPSFTETKKMLLIK